MWIYAEELMCIVPKVCLDQLPVLLYGSFQILIVLYNEWFVSICANVIAMFFFL